MLSVVIHPFRFEGWQFIYISVVCSRVSGLFFVCVCLFVGSRIIHPNNLVVVDSLIPKTIE